MLLIRRSPRAANAVRTVSPGGELFVASVVVCMILAAFGDAVDPTVFGEMGFEFAMFDLAGEFSVIAMGQWQLLELLLAGGAVAGGIYVLRVAAAAILQSSHPAPPQSNDKVPIKL